MKFFPTIAAMLATLPAMLVLAANDTSLENQDKPVGDSIPPCAVRFPTLWTRACSDFHISCNALHRLSPRWIAN